MSRRRLHGYTDFGPVQVPPLPTMIAMQDRETGAWWALSHVVSENFGVFEPPVFEPDVFDPNAPIDADGEPSDLAPVLVGLPANRNAQVKRFAAYEGPWLDRWWRLYVADGALAVERVDSPTRQDNAPVYTVRARDRTFLRLLSDQAGGIAYFEVTV